MQELSTDTPVITLVSGLPRSGTSMLMRMLSAADLPILTDEERAADDDNPRGYFEFERVKQLKDDKDWVSQAAGKVVKVISFLLPELPVGYHYRVLFMRRALPEVLASQAKMLKRRGEAPRTDDARMSELYQKHLNHVTRWLAEQPHFDVCYLDHRAVVQQPALAAQQINVFLGGGLDERAMAAAVEPSLYRNRVN